MISGSVLLTVQPCLSYERKVVNWKKVGTKKSGINKWMALRIKLICNISISFKF